MRHRPLALACLSIGLVVTLVAAVGAQAATGKFTGPGQPPAASGTVVAIDGHRLTVRAAVDGRTTAAPDHGVLVTVHHDGATENIPLTGLRHAGRGRPGRQDAPAYTLTVTGTNPAGKPDSGGYVMVVSPDNSSPYIGVLSHGSVTFSVPAGPYWVVASFNSISKTLGGLTYVDVLPQLTVTKNTTVHTAARAATSEVTMVTPRPAEAVGYQLEVSLTGAHSQGAEIEFFNAPGQIWIDPQPARPAAGTVRCTAFEQAYGTATGSAPAYLYNLAYADPAGSIPAQRYVVKPSTLATITSEYYQDITSAGAWDIYGGFPDAMELVSWFVGGLTPLPGKLTEYYATGPNLAWETIYDEFGSLIPAGGGESDDTFRQYRPGENQVVDWNRYPLHPQPRYSSDVADDRLFWLQPAALRAGNTLSLETYPFSDSVPGHLASGNVAPGNKGTDTYTIAQNGVKIASGPEGFNGIPPVTLSSKPSLVQFTFDATRTGPDYKLSTASRTVWTWHSAPDPAATVPHDWYCSLVPVHGIWVAKRRCSVQSMMTLDYLVSGMALDGTVPAGAQTVELTVGHIQLATAPAITAATASASCNGGKTWQRATVTSLGHGQYKLAFTEPARCDVTLRTGATDAAGNSITETITDAYAVAS
jgi:hypothetical protein